MKKALFFRTCGQNRDLAACWEGGYGCGMGSANLLKIWPSGQKLYIFEAVNVL